MKLLFKILLINSVIFGPLSAYAGWTGEVEVTRIVVVASGGINVKVEPGLTGCTSQSGYGASYASVYPDHKGLNSIHSNLLAAYMSGKKVSLYLADDTCKLTEMVLGGHYY
ncbi:MAG: hypothetical protein HRU08_13135 [Oleispira sp.]|nr:hypothetical protein [Oleispira sp.]